MNISSIFVTQLAITETSSTRLLNRNQCQYTATFKTIEAFLYFYIRIDLCKTSSYIIFLFHFFMKYISLHELHVLYLVPNASAIRED